MRDLIRAHLVSISVAALACALAPGAQAVAKQVGVASAVNQDAVTLSGGGQRTITIGKSIFFNERVKTSGGGLVQLLLVDGSAFTVGPNSDLVIDRFVYDPERGKGEMVASFSKGVLRFVGGKLSKSAGGVTVKSPAGALAVRGGILQAQVAGNRGRFSFVFGDEMRLDQTNGETLRVYTPGYTIDGLAGFRNAFTRPTTAEDTAFFLTQLAGRPGTDGGSKGGGPSNGQVEQGLGGVNDNAGPPNLPAVDVTMTDPDTIDQSETTTDIIVGDVINDGGGEEPPPEDGLTFRVLTNISNTGHRFLGGDPSATIDDFQVTLNPQNGQLIGTATGLTLTVDGETEPVPDTTFTLPIVTEPGVTPVEGAITPGPIDGESGDQTFPLVGSAFADSGFLAYRAFATFEEAIANDLLFLTGPAYAPINQPSGKLREFALYSDPRENLSIAFASGESAVGSTIPESNDLVMKPLEGEGVSKLLLLERDSQPGSRSVWLQTNFVLDGEGHEQSELIVALGGVGADGGLVGERRGGSQTFTDGEGQAQQSHTFTGGVATIAAPNGAHFLGQSNPNFVIGADTTNPEHLRPFEDTALDSLEPSGAFGTYHVGSQVSESTPVSSSQQGGTFTGFAAGIVRSEIPANNFVNVARNEAPSQVTMTFDPTTNTLKADFSVRAIGSDVVDFYNFGFGDDPNSPNDRSAYIDDRRYAAIERPGAASVDGDDEGSFANAVSIGTIVSHDQINADAQLFAGKTVTVGNQAVQKTAFCQNCDFIKWGAWSSRVNFGAGSTDEYSDNIHLGWWIAGNVTPNANLPTEGSASYDGDVVGSVSNDGRQYTATGDLALSWNFGSRAGRIDINNFDGRSYTSGDPVRGQGGISGPSDANSFSGGLTQVTNAGDPITGNVNGAFVSGPQNTPGTVPQGVIGNFDVHGSGYLATGIFGGVRSVVP